MHTTGTFHWTLRSYISKFLEPPICRHAARGSKIGGGVRSCPVYYFTPWNKPKGCNWMGSGGRKIRCPQALGAAKVAMKIVQVSNVCRVVAKLWTHKKQWFLRLHKSYCCTLTVLIRSEGKGREKQRRKKKKQGGREFGWNLGLSVERARWHMEEEMAPLWDVVRTKSRWFLVGAIVEP